MADLYLSNDSEDETIDIEKDVTKTKNKASKESKVAPPIYVESKEGEMSDLDDDEDKPLAPRFSSSSQYCSKVNLKKKEDLKAGRIHSTDRRELKYIVKQFLLWFGVPVTSCKDILLNCVNN